MRRWLAALFARFVAARSDAQLEWLMHSRLRGPLLHQMVRTIPRMLDPAQAANLSALVEMQVGGRRDGGEDRIQVQVEHGSCRASRRPLGEAAATVAFQPAAFLRFMGGGVPAPQLFVQGRLRVNGDLAVAAQMPLAFRFPGRRHPG